VTSRAGIRSAVGEELGVYYSGITRPAIGAPFCGRPIYLLLAGPAASRSIAAFMSPGRPVNDVILQGVQPLTDERDVALGRGSG
jgi:hypothetical protein